MKNGHWTLALTLFAACSAAASARALPEFPQELQDATDAPCSPHCNICHRDDYAGGGTVDQPFAISMERIGGLGHDVARAVERLRQNDVDSDGDGTSDIEEISRGDDPNTAYDAGICGPMVGCAAVSPSATGTQTTWCVGLAILWYALRRRRSHSRCAELRFTKRRPSTHPPV